MKEGRKLASIRIISNIIPISGADAIELALVDGWQCVVKKNEVKIGEHVVYFEIDSVLPVRSEFEFLRKSCYVSNDWITGFRLKTMRFRGQISQGLVLPISTFPELIGIEMYRDVTELLGIVKWDPPIPAQLAGKVKGNFPSFIPKTDQERIQNLYPKYKEKYADHVFEVSLKLDGASCTFYKYDEQVGVCSRNLDLDIHSEQNQENTYIRMFRMFESQLKSMSRNLAFQGELMGPGIQGNREKLNEHVFFLFDIFDIDRQRYLSATERKEVILDHMQHVPILCDHSFIFQTHSLEEILDYANCKSLHHSIAEGLVFKSIQDPSISFKAINNQFLLKEGSVTHGFTVGM